MNMRPSLAIKNALHLGTRNAEFQGNLLCRSRSNTPNGASSERITAGRQFWILSDLAHNILGDLAHPIFRTRAGSLLRCCVTHVIQLGSKEKMRGIYAQGIIALVANKHPFRYHAKSCLPLEATRDVVSFARSTNGEYAVSFVVDARFPVPAAFAFLLLGVKSIDRLLRDFHMSIIPCGAAQ